MSNEVNFVGWISKSIPFYAEGRLSVPFGHYSKIHIRELVRIVLMVASSPNVFKMFIPKC